MYLVQFVNFYSSIIYVAFFKGNFTGVPGRYNTLLGFRQEECGPIGCMTELCIQLAIIMVGKQIFGGFQEMGLPHLKRWWKQRNSQVSGTPEDQPNWVQDYYLEDWGPQSLFPEYLEMVLQYGFVTLFVGAFPLAPLFALLNNLCEVRLDSKKFLDEFKRPVSQRVKDIGSWSAILTSVSNLAIVSNALIIALASSVVPKLVYRLEFGTSVGYLNYSLAFFNTSDPDFARDTRPLTSRFRDEDTDFCRYLSFFSRDSRHQQSNQEWDREVFYWKVWLARLIFVILFQNIVTVCVVVLKWLIPDVPRDLSDRIRRENYWTMEAIILYETNRAQQKTTFGAAQTTSLKPPPLSKAVSRVSLHNPMFDAT